MLKVLAFAVWATCALLLIMAKGMGVAQLAWWEATAPVWVPIALVCAVGVVLFPGRAIRARRAANFRGAGNATRWPPMLLVAALLSCTSVVPTIAPATGSGDMFCFTMLVKTPGGAQPAIACSADEKLCVNAQRTVREQGGLAGVRGVSTCVPAFVTFAEEI